jgi:NAD(P)-dependent dehydrogenase (short-subunit alcohol dehydrogenase family)
MDVDSKDAAILVISGNGGIGSELVSRLAENDKVSVFSTYRTTHPTNDKIQWIQFESENCGKYDELISKICSNHDLKLVIDASGAFFASPIIKTAPEDIASVINTNLTAPLTLARACLKFMSAKGNLVLFSSVVTEGDLYGSSAYAASKQGLEKAITSLGEEFRRADKGIFGIRLGYMNYGMTFKIREDFRENIRLGLANQQFGEINGLLELIFNLTSNSDSRPYGTIVKYPD